MKIVFFGTSDRSIPILESLNLNFDLVLCVTKTDQIFGRKQEPKESGVKTWSKNHNINYLEIASLKDKDLEKVLRTIKSSKAEYGVVADFSFIIPTEIIGLFNNKLINVHFSLLPKYRGASPVQFSILNGDENTGITFHLVDQKMDMGAILKQVIYKMSGNETSGELYNVLFDQAADKIPDVIREYSSGKIKPISQEDIEATFTYSPSHPTSTFIYKEDAKINWAEKPEAVERKIRAYNPWPIAWTYLKDMKKSKFLYQGKIKLKKSVNKELKTKIYKAEVKENKLNILDLQIEGKNTMSWKDFENGYLA